MDTAPAKVGNMTVDTFLITLDLNDNLRLGGRSREGYPTQDAFMMVKTSLYISAFVI